jgi:hypothetical protein
MNLLNSINSAQTQTMPAFAGKSQDRPAAGARDGSAGGPYDEFVPLRSEPSIHSLKDYGKNITDSLALGYVGGFVKTSKVAAKFWPGSDSLHNMRECMIDVIPPALVGFVGGVAGAGAALVLGVVGKNIGTHMTGHTLQN